MKAEPQLADRAQLDSLRWGNWMRESLAGDSGAYERLMTELGDVIEAWTRSRFGSAHSVEDQVQECLLAIHRARGSWDPRRPFRPWLFAIVRHKTIDLLRRGNVRSREVSESSEHAEPSTPLAAHPDAALESALVLDRLPASSRDALTLTKLDGYTLAEAADRCGVSQTAMKSRVHRAIREVRSLLALDEGRS